MFLQATTNLKNSYIVSMSIKSKGHLLSPKHSKPFTYVAVGQPRVSRYCTEIIAVEAVLIAVGAFLLAELSADYDRVYVATESLSADINRVMAITTYLACVFLVSAPLAVRFFKLYKGLPVALAVMALLLAVLGYIEYDRVLMNIQSVGYDASDTCVPC